MSSLGKAFHRRHDRYDVVISGRIQNNYAVLFAVHWTNAFSSQTRKTDRDDDNDDLISDISLQKLCYQLESWRERYPEHPGDSLIIGKNMEK